MLSGVYFIPLQVECKLIHVASGTDIARHLPELCKHFQKIGSPIMIGKIIIMVLDVWAHVLTLPLKWEAHIFMLCYVV